MEFPNYIYRDVGVIVALLLYVPLGLQILFRGVKQNMATWILWCLMDGLAAGSLWAAGGNWTLSAAYSCGCVLIICCLLKVRIWEWSWFETVVVLIACLSLAEWYHSGPRRAAIFSTIGTLIAALPQLKEAYQDPHRMPLFVYSGYIITNILATMAGKGWTVEERLYSVACGILCLLTCVIIAARRKIVPASIVLEANSKLKPQPS